MRLRNICGGIAKTYTPEAESSEAYDAIYEKDRELYDYFGKNGIMEFLFDVKNKK